MASMKNIKLRIKSVESTMQITRAMKLVASSRLRRAQQRVLDTRPYHQVLDETLSEIASSNSDFDSKYLRKPTEDSKILYIVFAGDRGLAGGYNSNMFRMIEEETKGKNYCVLPVGKKAVEFCKKRGDEIFTESFPLVGELSVSDCFEMARLVCKGFADKEYDEIKIAGTFFVSPLSQVPRLQQLLPFEPKECEGPRPVVLYEPDPQEVFDAIIPEYISGKIYSIMCESAASEQGARRMAMENASNNAAEMIESLSLTYNRARQGAITQEITEIVAGASGDE
ncbi:F-type H+-transporting ATPase subunit gamma [Lachnospiraceae bacterium C10]|jgi:F-type H+-transporting ATPase subunit gamma|nr:ATP synthase F1 subunit gamma [Lachnospiraceae bacterium]SCW56817.1 F-type H+-transporting ATPase subunit gamma [Lachnospiraceae bacterium C10]SDW40890.1 ATP synthase F1 subcomplex gamma subunit [Lachnospiraceae bacterium KHCPX20]